jgi:hypothetical protein
LQDDNGKQEKTPLSHHGINAATAAVFIAGEMAGSGVLALPRALVDAGKLPAVGRNTHSWDACWLLIL